VVRTSGLAALATALLLAVAAAAWAGTGGLPGTHTEADRAAWRALLHWPRACDEAWQPGVDGAGIVLSATPSAGLRLVEVTCSLAAYQSELTLYLVGPRHHVAGPVVLATYSAAAAGRPRVVRESVLLGVLGFTPRTGRLTLFTKFRGPGDCGIYTVASLRGQRLATTEVRPKLACDGKPPHYAARWQRLPTP